MLATGGMIPGTDDIITGLVIFLGMIIGSWEILADLGRQQRGMIKVELVKVELAGVDLDFKAELVDVKSIKVPLITLC
jgi:hypothetical protein